MKFSCPHCNQSLECENDMAGMSLTCPECTRPLTIPPAVPPAQPPALPNVPTPPACGHLKRDSDLAGTTTRPPSSAQTRADVNRKKSHEYMKLTNILAQLQNKANTSQRIVVAVIVPIVAYLAAYGIMNFLSNNSDVPRLFRADPGDIGESWLVWTLILVAVGAFEFFWFRDHSATAPTIQPSASSELNAQANRPSEEQTKIPRRLPNGDVLFQCPHCKTVLQTPDDGYKIVKCKRCGEFCSVPGDQMTAPKTTSRTVCSIIGWICLLLNWIGLYNGGKPHDGFILESFIHNHIPYALGGLVGRCPDAFIALIMGIFVRKRGAGRALIIASIISLLISFFVF